MDETQINEETLRDFLKRHQGPHCHFAGTLTTDKKGGKWEKVGELWALPNEILEMKITVNH